MIASTLTKDPLFSNARDQESGWCVYCRAVCCSAAAADAESIHTKSDSNEVNKTSDGQEPKGNGKNWNKNREEKRMYKRLVLQTPPKAS